MCDYIPFILKEEETRIRNEITGRFLSVVFDGTSRLGEALAVILRFISDDWVIQQCLVRVQLLSKSLSGEEIARELISILSVNYGVQSTQLLGAMRDRASANNVAMQTIKVVYPCVHDIGCFSHMIDQVGNLFNTSTLNEFISTWISLFSHSFKAQVLWKSRTDCSVKSYSATRWWSKWEVMRQLMVYFGDLLPFLEEHDGVAPACRLKLLGIIHDSDKLAHLKIELAATVDIGEPFVKACYYLEGDGPVALHCYESVEKLLASARIGHMPNVNATVQSLTGKPITDPQSIKWINYAKLCVKPGIDYFKKQISSNMSNSLKVFKACRLFLPQKAVTMKLDVKSVTEAFDTTSFLSSREEFDQLIAELPAYLACAADTDDDADPINWWKKNAAALPLWSAAAAKAMLLQPSSAAAERVFSLLRNSFGEQQEAALQDYIEASLMLQHNR